MHTNIKKTTPTLVLLLVGSYFSPPASGRLLAETPFANRKSTSICQRKLNRAKQFFLIENESSPEDPKYRPTVLVPPAQGLSSTNNNVEFVQHCGNKDCDHAKWYAKGPLILSHHVNCGPFQSSAGPLRICLTADGFGSSGYRNVVVKTCGNSPLQKWIQVGNTLRLLGDTDWCLTNMEAKSGDNAALTPCDGSKQQSIVFWYYP